MYFAYLRFNFKKQDFVMRLPIKAQIRTYKNVKCVHIIKCAKVRALVAKIKCFFLHMRNNYVLRCLE